MFSKRVESPSGANYFETSSLSASVTKQKKLNTILGDFVCLIYGNPEELLIETRIYYFPSALLNKKNSYLVLS